MNGNDTLFLLLTIGCLSARGVNAGDVTIHVQDKAGRPATQTVVYALQFGTNGPDGKASLRGITDKRGNVSFRLDDKKKYEIIADKHGLGPTARAQIFNLSRLHLPMDSHGKKEITLGQPFEDRGLIALTAAHATPNTFVIGAVRSKADGKDVAFAGNVADEHGNVLLVFNNVPPSAANAYVIDVYDPSGTAGNKHYDGEIAAVSRDERTSLHIDLNAPQSAMLPQ